jgi:D-glycero-alpha-D-manno-heptose-7-phosphate kinase
MIISRTPFRISFFGGGTDYPVWYRDHGGCVLATSINKYCYLSCRYLPPFFEHKYRLVYVKSENCKTIDEISHPAVRGILQYLNWTRGLEIHHDADLPARGGLGTSSSFTVGLINALSGLRGKLRSKNEIALESINIEQNILKETVGSQDQISAAYGGFNYVRFHQNGEIAVQPITVSPNRIKELESRLMLFYTGIKRTASMVAQSYFENIERKTNYLSSMSEMVEKGIAALDGNVDINKFGKLLHEAWLVKKKLSEKISSSEVDEIYSKALNAGAVGGKILGAGGGGFILFFVPLEYQRAVREALGNFIYVPFKFEYSGTQVVYYDPQEDFEEIELDREKRTIKEFRENC